MNDLVKNWDWDRIFINYCVKDMTFQQLSDHYRKENNGDGPSVGTIHSRSIEENWKKKKEKYLSDRRNLKIQEILKQEVIALKKEITTVNKIIDVMGADVVAKLSEDKRRFRIKGDTSNTEYRISKYDASLKDLERAIKLKAFLLENTRSSDETKLKFSYPMKNMSEEDKEIYREFLRKKLGNEAVDAEFIVVDPGNEDNE